MENGKYVKILHYCWFGGAPLPAETIEYMKSWKKFLPDFEIMRWDETNFDIHSVPFVEDAYNAKKWAFVSDYVRCYALYKFGGLYLDTDVQIIRGLDDLFVTSFMGFEHKEVINPGLILYAKEANSDFYGELINRYNGLTFDLSNILEITSPLLFTRLLNSKGLKGDNTLQKVNDITIYPMEYFNPIGDDIYSKPDITENTRTIHWYQASWFDPIDLVLFNLRKKYGYKKGTFLFILKHPVSALRRKRNSKNLKISV